MCDPNREKMEKWVQIAIKQQDFSHHEFEVEGQTSKGDGYSGEINFVKVTGTTKNGEEKILNLAIKSSKTNEKVRAKATVGEAYMKEIYIYEKVKPTFESFLREKGIKENISFMSHCYGTAISENCEALVFENLRTGGFKLWDRFRPLTYKHAQLVLESYGKWHALSMALKVKKPKIFQDLTKDNINMFSYFLDKTKFDITMGQEFENAKNSAISPNEKELLKHLQYSSSDVKYALNDMYFEDPEDHVILHGDCWNSNFLFKYSDDETNPSDIRILDWQCSGLGSVAFDLSHFIYCCVDTGEFDDVKEMLKTYHNTLARYLTLLGCDPESVFPFDKLLVQWKKFSRFGLILSSLVIRICLMKNDEVPDLTEAAEKEDLVAAFTFQTSSDEVFLKRVRNNFVHYAKNVQ